MIRNLKVNSALYANRRRERVTTILLSDRCTLIMMTLFADDSGENLHYNPVRPLW